MLKGRGVFAPPMVTLLIVSNLDIASTIQGDALLARGGWSKMDSIEDGRVWKHQVKDVWLWWFGSRFLMEDELDTRFSAGAGVSVDEVIFLSRHYAASGRPSLTLHVLGVPGETPHGERAEHGGIKGEVMLPCTRFASWYRLMCDAAHHHQLASEFELTIETTHHGPRLDVPTMFIEIGSSESEVELIFTMEDMEENLEKNLRILAEFENCGLDALSNKLDRQIIKYKEKQRGH